MKIHNSVEWVWDDIPGVLHETKMNPGCVWDKTMSFFVYIFGQNLHCYIVGYTVKLCVFFSWSSNVYIEVEIQKF